MPVLAVVILVVVVNMLIGCTVAVIALDIHLDTTNR
jgi:hypothetical protein